MERFLKLRKAMKLERVRLTYRSLLRMSLYILGGFLLLSIAAEKFFPSDSGFHLRSLFYLDYTEAEKESCQLLKENPADAKTWRLLIRERAKADFQNSLKFLHRSGSGKPAVEFFLTDQEFKEFVRIAEDPSPEALLYLKFLYEKENEKQLNLPGSNEVFLTHSTNLSIEKKEELGRFHFDLGRYDQAAKVLKEVAAEDPQNSEVKDLVMKAVQRTDTSEFMKMLEDPEWVDYADHSILVRYYLEKHSYHKMLYHLTLSQYVLYSAESIIICLLAGLGWVIFLMHLGHAWSWKRKELLMIPAAFILGYLSTQFCLGVVVAQDHFIKFDGNNNNKGMLFNFAYCVFGIGLREEVCKMLFFMPLLPFLIKVKENYKILVYCSLVGLGFAVEENIGYWLTSQYGGQAGGSAIMGRFLTANFIHMFLTGYICFYLTMAFKKKGKAWDDFTMALVKMIVIHGVYDFFLIDPVMLKEGFHFFAMMIAIFMSMQYIRLLLYSAPPTHPYVSLTRVFTIVLCFTVGITLFSMSIEVGVKEALKMAFAGMLFSAIFAYMFYREFDERIG